MLGYLAVLQDGSGQSGIQKILSGIPHDPAAIFIYIFLAVSIYLIWRGSRSRA
jgi:hypothetical protein